jgi:hypothetical protein
MNSTKGVGRSAPNKSEVIEGALIPCDKVESTGFNNVIYYYIIDCSTL